MAMDRSALSGNDAAVLGALFDPEASLSNRTNVEDSLPTGYTESSLRAVQGKEKAALLGLNREDPSRDDIKSTISALDALIERHPGYASAWNNRAQARRMLFNLGTVEGQQILLREIMEDLDQAIERASPSSPTALIPTLNASVLASAYTHRALLFCTASRSEELRQTLTSAVPRLSGFDAPRLEEAASHEFAAGGRYGNDVAKQLAVKLNPYAKLCGSIVKEAMQKEISDHYQIPISGVN